MIPYILTAVGGYLIGSSLKKSQDGKYEDGGDIKFDNADEIIKILSKNGYKVSKPESFYNGSSYGKDYQILGFELVDAYTKYLGLPIKKSPYGFIVNKNNKLQNFYYHTNERGFNTTSKIEEFLNNIPKNTNYANGGDIEEPKVEEEVKPTEEQVELPNYGKAIDTKMGKVDLIIEPNTQSENKNSIKVSAYDSDGNTLGFSSAVIDAKNKKLTIKVSQIKDKYQRNGIYSKIIDEYESIAKEKGLKLVSDSNSRSQAAKEFWNNREQPKQAPEKIISLYESFYENGKEYMRLLAQGVYTKEREEQFKKRAKEAIDKKFDEGRYDYKQEVYVHNKNVREPYLQKYQVFANGGEIANTILSQLGGARRLNIMTGAYNFVDLGKGVSFKLKNPRANYVKIQLNSMDLYDIEVGRIRGTDYKVVNSANNLYFDQLKPFIEKATGLYLSL